MNAEQLTTEMSRFLAALRLTADQRSQADRAHRRALDALAQGSESDTRVAAAEKAFRAGLIKFLTPEQLAVWDAAVAKARRQTQLL